MDDLAQLLLDRSRKADEDCRHRVVAHLESLRKMAPSADARFEVSRALSSHDYDLYSRARHLEAVLEEGFETISGLINAPTVALSDADQEEFLQAVKDALEDQKHFFRAVSALANQSGEPR